jgi:RNA polymerase sigma-70 factor (ECF subfamily)
MSETISLDLKPKVYMDEDAKLVLAAQQNPQEFKNLYQKWLGRIFRYFYFRVGNKKDAEDLTSQLFLKVYEDLPCYHNRGYFSAWLFAIAHARLTDFYRKGRKEIALSDLTPEVNVPDLLSRSAHRIEIEQLFGLLRSLSVEEQELIRLRFAADLSYQEIGAILNRKEDAVRKSIARLLERMQVQLEVYHD